MRAPDQDETRDFWRDGWVVVRGALQGEELSVNSATVQTEEGFRQYSPYLWSYEAGGDAQADGLVAYACRKLAGGTADFAGPQPGPVTRSFAILVSESANTRNRAGIGRQVQASLKRSCGVVVPDELLFYNPGDGSAATGDKRTTWAIAVRDKQVSTVLAVGDVFGILEASSTFDNLAYIPELVSTSFVSVHENFIISAFGRPTQRRAYINLVFGSQSLSPLRTPGLATVRYQDPGWVLDPREGNSMYNNVYKPMLVLASGIQLAGPNLTPETFRAGLQRTRFPNPQDSRALGKVGFDTGDHTMVDDALESFWAEGATGPDGQNAGAWCYPTQRRYGFQGRADWDRDTSRYFRQPCETGRGV